MYNQLSQTHQQTLTERCDVRLNKRTVEFDLEMVVATRNPENSQMDGGRWHQCGGLYMIIIMGADQAVRVRLSPSQCVLSSLPPQPWNA